MKVAWAGVNPIMASGNVIRHQPQERPQQEVSTTMCVTESKNSSRPQYYDRRLHGTRNEQELKRGLGVFCLPQGVVRGVHRSGAKMVVRVKTTKWKIEAAGAKTCPAQMKERRGLSTQQNAVLTDRGLWKVMKDMISGVLQDIEFSQEE